MPGYGYGSAGSQSGGGRDVRIPALDVPSEVFFGRQGKDGRDVSVRRDSGDGGGLSVVLVRGGATNAIVPAESFGRWPALPGGSVSLAGMKRAATSVREDVGERNVAVIAEATLGGQESGCSAQGCAEVEGLAYAEIA